MPPLIIHRKTPPSYSPQKALPLIFGHLFLNLDHWGTSNLLHKPFTLEKTMKCSVLTMHDTDLRLKGLEVICYFIWLEGLKRLGNKERESITIFTYDLCYLLSHCILPELGPDWCREQQPCGSVVPSSTTHVMSHHVMKTCNRIVPLTFAI